MLPPFSPKQTIDKTVREEWGRILAALVKYLGDFQLAEDCLQEAVISALHHWESNGLPNNPAAWLITTARRKALDRLRRDANFASKQDEIAYLIELDNTDSAHGDDMEIPDKRLEMIFTCCHPALEEKTRVALTLRTLGGLTTEEIAMAFLDKPETMAQRLARAKNKISKAGIAYKVPDIDLLPQRLSSVLNVIYLIFNEGYSASSGEGLTREDLCAEAIRLARIVYHLMPNEPEVGGLLALLLLHDSRRQARTDNNGQMVSLENQNRARWHKGKIEEGVNLLEEILPKQKVGPFQLQAAISAVHGQSNAWEDTDWPQILALYQLLHKINPTKIIQINMAVAVSYVKDCATALELLNKANVDGKLDRYQPFHAARADFLGRIGCIKEAFVAFDTAIELSENKAEKSFLLAKRDSLPNL